MHDTITTNLRLTIALKGRQELGGFSKHYLTIRVHRLIKSSRHALLPPLMRAVILIKRNTMLNKNEIILETTDFNLAKDLIKESHNDITVSIYETRDVQTEEIAKFIITFVRDVGLVYLGHWLSSRQSKEGSDKTTLNKNKLPQSEKEITALIKQELQKIQADQDK